MNLTTDKNHDISIVRVNEARLMYPLLSEFSGTVTSLIGAGERKVLVDLSTVTYVDSATIGLSNVTVPSFNTFARASSACW